MGEHSRKVFQETSLIKFQMFWRKLKKDKNKTIHTVFKISTDLFQVRHGSLSLQTNTRKNKQTRKCKQTVPNVVSYKKRRTKKSRKKYSRKFQEKSRKYLK